MLGSSLGGDGGWRVGLGAEQSGVTVEMGPPWSWVLGLVARSPGLQHLAENNLPEPLGLGRAGLHVPRCGGGGSSPLPSPGRAAEGPRQVCALDTSSLVRTLESPGREGRHRVQEEEGAGPTGTPQPAVSQSQDQTPVLCPSTESPLPGPAVWPVPGTPPGLCGWL